MAHTLHAEVALIARHLRAAQILIQESFHGNQLSLYPRQESQGGD